MTKLQKKSVKITLTGQFVLEYTRSKIEELFENIDELEAKVINNRFGLFAETSHTIEETATLLNLTSRKVSKLERSALKKMKIRCEASKLKSRKSFESIWNII